MLEESRWHNFPRHVDTALQILR